MSRYQRDKGARWEREVVIKCNERGLEAERNLSQSRDGGHDIDTLAGKFECKRRARLPDYLMPTEEVPYVAARADNHSGILILDLDEGLDLLADRYARSRRPTLAQGETLEGQTGDRIVGQPASIVGQPRASKG